jgi:hypothetical protein
MKQKEPHNSQWLIVTFNRPLMWARNDDETWMFNPNRRYVMNANQLGNLQGFLDTVSDLKTSALYRPLEAGAELPGAQVLVERYRERGVGDLLFMTGPLSYMNYVSGGNVKIDMYALADRGCILANHPALRYGATLAGPLHYDDLQHYNHHWFLDTVTEYDEERDQLNVYDALYKTLGFDYSKIAAEFKRPSLVLAQDDIKNLDQFLYYVWLEKKIDLRKTGYYVVAPLARGSLRSAPYQSWMNIIDELKKVRPVVVVGSLDGRLPATDMTAGEFNQKVDHAGSNVINAMRSPPMPLRVLCSIISKATAVACLDSGPLYIAQALRVPAISMWGPHDPQVRIGYDQDYMSLAVWNKEHCQACPCYAYDRFPTDRCPNGEAQTVCEPLFYVNVEEVLRKFEGLEKINRPVTPTPSPQ